MEMEYIHMDQNLGKTGDASIKKVGHTYAGIFGIEPNAKAKGVAASEPTPQTFGK